MDSKELYATQPNSLLYLLRSTVSSDRFQSSSSETLSDQGSLFMNIVHCNRLRLWSFLPVQRARACDCWMSDGTHHLDAEATRHISRPSFTRVPCEKSVSLFLSFPYVRPEPVLVK